MTDKNRVYIFDTTMRDGEQSPGASMSLEEKLQISRVFDELGVDIIEAGFPISSPGDFNSVVEISKNVKRPIICALSRALVDDINMAHVSLKSAERRRLHTGIGSSDIHIKHKFNSTREKILDQAVAAVKYARRYFEDIEFYPEDAGRADPDFLAKMVEKVVDAGAALKSGIKDLDVILSIDNIEVNSVNALQEKICQYDSGNKINCLIKRNKKEMQIEVILR